MAKQPQPASKGHSILCNCRHCGVRRALKRAKEEGLVFTPFFHNKEAREFYEGIERREFSK